MITDLNINICIFIQASFKDGELELSLTNPISGNNKLTSLDMTGYSDVPETMSLLFRFYSGEELEASTSQITVFLSEFINSDSEREDKRLDIELALLEFMQKNIIGLEVCDGLGNNSKIIGIKKPPSYSYYSWQHNGGFVFDTGIVIQGSNIMNNDFESFDTLKHIGSLSDVMANNDNDSERMYNFKRSQFFYYLSHMYMYRVYEKYGAYTFAPKLDKRFLDADIFYDAAKSILTLNRRHKAELNRYYRAIKDMQDNTWHTDINAPSYYEDFNIEYGHIARGSYKKVAQLIADFANKNPKNFMRLYNGERSFRAFFYDREYIICHIKDYLAEQLSLNLIA